MLEHTHAVFVDLLSAGQPVCGTPEAAQAAALFGAEAREVRSAAWCRSAAAIGRAIPGTDPLAIRDRALLELIYSSGLRVSEAVGLDLNDLDLVEREVRVTGKGQKRRIVPVRRDAVETMPTWLPVRAHVTRDPPEGRPNARPKRREARPRAPGASPDGSRIACPPSDTVGQGLPLTLIDVFAVDRKGFTPDDGAIWVAVDHPCFRACRLKATADGSPLERTEEGLDTCATPSARPDRSLNREEMCLPGRYHGDRLALEAQMIKKSIRVLTSCIVPSALLLAAVALLSVARDIPVGMFTRDPTALADMDPLTGMLSNLGILLWCATAAISLFAAEVLYGAGRTDASRFLFWSATLTMVLMLDDLFQFHEDLAERYLGLGDGAVYVLLGLWMVGYLAAFGQTILRGEYALVFAFAFALLGVSVSIDAVFERWLWRLGSWDVFVEDGAKFLGIASWCGYFTGTAYGLLTALSGIAAASTVTGIHAASEVDDRRVGQDATSQSG